MKKREKCWKPALYPLVYIGMGTLAPTERQEDKLVGAENNWVRIMCKVKREYRRKTGELR